MEHPLTVIYNTVDYSEKRKEAIANSLDIVKYNDVLVLWKLLSNFHMLHIHSLWLWSESFFDNSVSEKLEEIDKKYHDNLKIRALIKCIQCADYPGIHKDITM